MSYVRLDKVTKRYREIYAARNISLAIEKGEFFCLVGPSGSGKTTMLRLIAGFVRPTAGRVYINGRRIDDQPPYKRDVGIVFQNYALFPHMSVRDNVAFGLRVRNLDRVAIDQRIEEMLDLVQLRGFEDRRPDELSGGQQQRVALVRALVTRPRVLLLDEPLGALDKKLRTQMQVELKQIQREVGITTIFVTHDQEEALSLSDRVGVIDKGVLVQLGSPTEVYERPTNHFVANFIGQSNFFKGEITDLGDEGVVVTTPSGAVLRGSARSGLSLGQQVTLAVRPEKVRLTTGDVEAHNRLEGTVVHVTYLGNSTSYVIDSRDGGTVIALQQNLLAGGAYPAGTEVVVTWSKESCFVVAANPARVAQPRQGSE